MIQILTRHHSTTRELLTLSVPLHTIHTIAYPATPPQTLLIRPAPSCRILRKVFFEQFLFDGHLWASDGLQGIMEVFGFICISYSNSLILNLRNPWWLPGPIPCPLRNLSLFYCAASIPGLKQVALFRFLGRTEAAHSDRLELILNVFFLRDCPLFLSYFLSFIEFADCIEGSEFLVKLVNVEVS